MPKRICPIRNAECTDDCLWYYKEARELKSNPNYVACSVLVTKNRLAIMEERIELLIKLTEGK